MRKQPVTPEHPTGATPPQVSLPRTIELADDRDGRSPGLAIISSKIEGPVGSTSVLTRPRLVGWLDQHRSARVILVSAEAGYGKSTLLADFSLRTSSTCIWYRLETSDRDWTTLLSYLVASLREAVPGFGRPTEALLRHVAAMGPSREVVVAQFLSDLGAVANADITLILDDYHLVEGSDDVRMIMARLIERAPNRMRFVLAGRGKPDLSLGRLAAQGRVAELTTGDLRFTRTEIEQLFETAYRQPLERATCDVVERRTEGWAASLQLVSASIATSRPSEVSTFIEALSGADGPIYDFLAEEVLARLSELTQRVLIHASLVDRVQARLVTAALSLRPDAPSIDAVRACLEEAEGLGLLGGRGESRTGVRIHPLLRQFLEHQLAETAPIEVIESMHLAIAREIDGEDWLVAGKHYALARHSEDAMRVLGSAASEALGTGAWGAAAEVIALMPDAVPPPAVEVIKARALTSDGRPNEALAVLNAIEPSAMDQDATMLWSLARAAAHQVAGHGDALWAEVQRLGALEHSNRVVTHLARTWALIREACRGESIVEARRALDQLVVLSSASRLDHFAGIALHNSATSALAQGDYEAATRLAARARLAFVDTPSDASIGHSALITQAIAQAELGNIVEALAMAEVATSARDAHPDVIADAAYLAAVCGYPDRADSLNDRLRRLMASGPLEVGTTQQAGAAVVATQLARGNPRGAAERALELGIRSVDELDGVSRSSYLVALTAALIHRRDTLALVKRAIKACEQQRAWRWDPRLRLIQAAIAGNQSDLPRWICECDNQSGLAILELADVLGEHLHHLGVMPDAITASISRHPERWRPILLRQVQGESLPTAHEAARMLTRFGTKDDAAVLAAYERRVAHSGRRPRLSRDLVRRISPTLRVHDLGRTTYEVAGVEVTASASRRKALSLVLFLVTRPKQTATREQLMEQLWPNQSPSSATNSLHQTLHFVRREIAPWEEGTTADYVPLDSELIYLDPELVQVDSVAFLRQAREALVSGDLGRVGPSVVKLYGGRFAPEFEYEDWAEDWRNLLHTKFLHLAHSTAEALLADGRIQAAVEVLSRAIEIDGLALELRATLIRTLSESGATDAAGDQYRHYSSLMRRELGVRAPPFDQLLAGIDTHAPDGQGTA